MGAIPGVVVMGVSGCGKTSVAAGLAADIGGRLIEGDAYHPQENIAKMSAGLPLDDADRAGWLDQLAQILAQSIAAGETPVLACSALKAAYRDRLRAASPQLGFVFLEIDRAAAAQRVQTRPGHFMPASLIDSQFAALEPPKGEPHVLTVDATEPVEAILHHTTAWWQQNGAVPALR